ncbi:hypothetical protein [Acrocarpospora sp. B8E8]|uniref:hypothetical protein n=1 Tax=Acrocarpospora sp. B8E8 TaxID=3153572 RepID=UPI00325F889D
MSDPDIKKRNRKSKIAGYRWESDLAKYLSSVFRRVVERNGTRYGGKDRGDLSGVPYLVIEAKNEARIDLSGYMREVAAEMANHPDARFGVAVVKARGKPTGRAYAVMELDWFCELYAEYLASAS